MFFLNNIPGVNYGHFHLVCGNMFGGKTTELLDLVYQFKRQEKIRVQAALREGKDLTETKFQAFKPTIDIRYDETKIVSHDGRTLDATPVSSVANLIKTVKENDYRVIAIDEIQFFQKTNTNSEVSYYEIAEAIFELRNENRYIIASGLSKDFRGLPFGAMGDLLALADEITVKNSKCAVCGADAPLSQRLVNGQASRWDEPLIVVGNDEQTTHNESYEPRCRRCHKINMERNIGNISS